MPKPFLNLRIEKIPVHCETQRGFKHTWAASVDGAVVTNPNDEDGLFGSIKSARKGLARHLGVDDPMSLEINVRK